MYDLEQKVHKRVKECVETLDLDLEVSLMEGLERIARKGANPLMSLTRLSWNEMEAIAKALYEDGFEWSDPDNAHIYRDNLTDALSIFMSVSVNNEIHNVEIYSKTGAVVVEVGEES